MKDRLQKEVQQITEEKLGDLFEELLQAGRKKVAKALRGVIAHGDKKFSRGKK